MQELFLQIEKFLFCPHVTFLTIVTSYKTFHVTKYKIFYITKHNMFYIISYNQCYEKTFSNTEKSIDTTPQMTIMNNISYPRESRNL